MGNCTVRGIARFQSIQSQCYAIRAYTNTTIKLNHTNNNSNKPDWYNKVAEWTKSIYDHSQCNPVIRTSQLESDIQHRFYTTFNENNDKLKYYHNIQQYHDKQIPIHPASHLAYFVNHTHTKYVSIQYILHYTVYLYIIYI